MHFCLFLHLCPYSLTGICRPPSMDCISSSEKHVPAVAAVHHRQIDDRFQSVRGRRLDLLYVEIQTLGV